MTTTGRLPLKSYLWIVDEGGFHHDSGLDTSRGIGSVKYSNTTFTPTTASLTFVAPVSAGTNTFDLCVSVAFATTLDPANRRGVFRYRNLVATVIPGGNPL